MWLESSPIRIRKLGILVLMVMTSLGHASIVIYDYLIMVSHYFSKMCYYLCYSSSQLSITSQIFYKIKRVYFILVV